MRISNVVLTLLTVFVLLLGGIGIINDRSDRFAKPPARPTQSDEVARQVSRDLGTDLFFIASDALSMTKGVNLDQTNIYFKAAAKELLDKRYAQRAVGDYKAEYKTHELSIKVLPMSMVASRCSGNLSVSGEIVSFAAPAYYRIDGAVTFDLKGPSDHVATVNITVDKVLPDLTPYVTTRLAELDANGKSEATDIGRMVRYILTTLVRFRASQGIGSGPYDTEKDLLNEGDVELAVNLAVQLEEARLFGTFDKAALSAMDHNYLRATDPAAHKGEVSWEPYNPTGLRPWGSAEIKNYARYQNRMSLGSERSMVSLFQNYVKDGLVDPADLLALYLNLDHYESGTSFDPSDQASILSERFLLDGRYPADRRDASHLVYRSSVGPRELLLRDPAGAFTGSYRELLRVDQNPDYLTIGSSVAVSRDITIPYKWMTNTRLSEGSRTGGVPPPQPPPDHDWIMQWNFGIYGNFTVAVGRDRASSQDDGTMRSVLVNKTVRLDIPISIYAFLSLRPMNSAMTFTNLNIGSPPGATYNFTWESLVYEHFSNSTWAEFKEVFGAVVGDAMTLIKSSTCPYPAAIAEGLSVSGAPRLAQSLNLSSSFWSSIADFVQKRIVSPDISTQILRPFMNSEYMIDIDYLKGNNSPYAYTLRLKIITNYGDQIVDLNIRSDSSPGTVGLNNHLIVPGLLDVDYYTSWPFDKGEGTMDGKWSQNGPNKDIKIKPASYRGVAINLGDGTVLRLLPDAPDPIADALISAIPKDLGPDPAKNLASIAKAIEKVDTKAIILLLSTDDDSWSGLKGTDALATKAMLAWVANHSKVLIDLVHDGNLDQSSIGMAAAKVLASRQDIMAISISATVRCEAPIAFYYVYSQLFQVDRPVGDLKAMAISTSISSHSTEPLNAVTFELGYTTSSWAILSDPEVDYG